MSAVAIIPARGGSKGIPKKNVKDFCGKPLLAWSILQAKATPEIDAVYVTSDSDEILGIAETYGAKAIRRPEEISGDKATSESALVHALEQMPKEPELVAFLQPTSPLRFKSDLSRGIQELRKNGWDSAFSGAILDDFLIWERAHDGTFSSFNYDYKSRGRRQDRKPQYVENGSFWLFKPEILKSLNNRMGGKIGVCLQALWQSFEIDNPEDWEFIETLFKHYRLGEN